ncbi:protein shisa-6 isoform X4 [Xenopus laevis]|uniref:Protein shisa-6 isoform X4 n=1 Tax=Xenopus laevis TaxID=8355 RepID=A0A8J1LZX9_XENLA|nr:protein shisa-6 isoform X4 [Xenopus laevis]
MRWHLLLLLVICLYLVGFLDHCEAVAKTKGNKNAGPAKKTANPPKGKDVNNTAVPPVVTTRRVKPPVVVAYDKCMGYYDVSGQWDKEFDCNHTAYRYCCGTCSFRFCCDTKTKRLDQVSCKKPVWTATTSTDVIESMEEEAYDPRNDKTNTTVYITGGVIAFIFILGVCAKIAYDKARNPPREMNIHRALADILIQQGPIPIPHCEREAISAVDNSPKENTPARSSKNHYTPVRTSKTNHGTASRRFSDVPTSMEPPAPLNTIGGHYGKDIYRSGGPDLHNFISSGFVTLGRGHVKGDHQQNYNHLVLNSSSQTPTNEKPRMNNILTSATEPYDLSFSRSFQNLSHLPPSYESAVKTNPSKYSSLKKLTDKEADEYYTRRRHLPDLAARGTLPINVIKMTQDQSNHRERPRRPVRAMSQDRVLSPERAMPEEGYGMPYDRILSDEQLLSAERLHSQDPLLSPDKAMTLKRSDFQEKSMSRAISQTDVFVSTPVLDRYRMTKMHSHPSASNNLYNTLAANQTAAKRQAFASRRHNTVEQLHYIPGHHQQYRTASKTEVTV